MKKTKTLAVLATAFAMLTSGTALGIGLPTSQLGSTLGGIVYGPLNAIMTLTGLKLPAIPVGTPVDLSPVLNLAGQVLDKTGLYGTPSTGKIQALIPMPLDPNKTCESCHSSRSALITAMTDTNNNKKYPGLSADVAYVENYYVSADYADRADSMMSKAKLSPLWNGCKTCHSTGAGFDPFPSDNWMPNSNPERPGAAWAGGSTNDTSKTCGKCHYQRAKEYNAGMMGTHRGHLGAFNFNDVEQQGSNTNSDFHFSPLGSTQAGQIGDAGRAGFKASRASCSACHQSCSDCHMTGPGDNPISLFGAVNVAKGALGTERIWMDQGHYTTQPRVKAYVAQALRRGGVFILELRKGYVSGVSRGVPYSNLEAGMDIGNHKIVMPTMAGQGTKPNVIAPQTQEQSIQFCWRCHFRSGAEYSGNWINVVPNPNYPRSNLVHLNAGMTCTDCHSAPELMGATSKDSAVFSGSSEAVDNPSHPGGSPRGMTPAWPISPSPVKVSCQLCHTKEGQALGATGGAGLGQLVTPKFQSTAKVANGLEKFPVPNKPNSAITMSHANIKCEVCHVEAQQNCWNCHLETADELGALPGVNSQDGLNIKDLYPSIVNVREAEGEGPVATAAQKAFLKEEPCRNDVANLVLGITNLQSVNTVNKAPRYLGINNFGQVASMVHCPGTVPGVNNNPYTNPQPLNLDGGLYITKSGAYGTDGSIPDVTYAAQGSWYMEAGHSIARTPDGAGYTACYNCHADATRLGKEPITYYRKNPWVMKSAGDAQAILPDSHFLDGRYKDSNGNFYCACHSPSATVHTGTVDGPFPAEH